MKSTVQESKISLNKYSWKLFTTNTTQDFKKSQTDSRTEWTF